MILCGDIGGTKTHLALFHRDRPHAPEGLTTYPSGSAHGLHELLVAYLDGRSHALEAACFAVAGPVVNGRVETTNLPWVIEAAQLTTDLGGVPVFLLNDLESLA